MVIALCANIGCLSIDQNPLLIHHVEQAQFTKLIRQTYNLKALLVLPNNSGAQHFERPPCRFVVSKGQCNIAPHCQLSALSLRPCLGFLRDSLGNGTLLAIKMGQRNRYTEADGPVIFDVSGTRSRKIDRLHRGEEEVALSELMIAA